jgi:hypothetical protein
MTVMPLIHFDRLRVEVKETAARTHHSRNVEMKGRESRLAATLSFTPDYPDGPRKEQAVFRAHAHRQAGR